MSPFGPYRTQMVGPDEALPGRLIPEAVADRHWVLGGPLAPPFPDGLDQAMFGMGCFWGAEKIFWQAPGIVTTAVGYAGGYTPNPTYEEVCSTDTGHAEVVLVVFDPARTDYRAMLTLFWEGHDPTQGMRQGNDIGTQYRSAIYAATARHLREARESGLDYGRRLQEAGYGPVTTEIRNAPDFYYAAAYHQQYLAKNPGGYCGLGGTGVRWRG